MPKFTSFTIAPDGRLVYLSNGNVVKGNVNYASNRSGLNPRGYTVIGNRVYHNGRLAGYTKKPNKKQQEQINKRAQNRQKRNEKSAFKQFVDDGGYGTKKGGWEALKDAKRSMDAFRTSAYTFNLKGENIFYSLDENGLLNYASVLDQAVEINLIDIDEANALWEEYVNGSRETRNRLWDDINRRFDEEGYEIDSPPLFGEIGRMLGIDVKRFL